MKLRRMLRGTLALLAVVVVVVVLAGCRGVTVAREDMPPALQTIHTSFSHAVADAYADPDLTWRAGWLGNMAVNFTGARSDNRGLCWHWQEMIYSAVKPVADRVGWACAGVQMNPGRFSEHHAVMVYDPGRLLHSDPLADDDAVREQVFVLDAWRYGEPDIFTLSEWLRLSSAHDPVPMVEDLTALDESSVNSAQP